MDRIGPAGGTPLAMLPNGQLGRQDQNLSTGTEGTLDPSLWSNALQEEIMLLLATAGITPNINNWTQVLAAIQVIIQQAVAAYVDADGFFYFILGTVAGFNLTICGGPAVVPVGVSSINQILPITFNTAFLGGLCADMGASGWGYGVLAGGDLSHCEIYCPIYQITAGGGVSPRPTEATGYFICVGY